MNDLLPTIINGLFYIFVGGMALVLLLSIYIFIKYSINRLFSTILSVIVVLLFLIGVLIAFNTAQEIIKIYA